MSIRALIVCATAFQHFVWAGTADGWAITVRDKTFTVPYSKASLSLPVSSDGLIVLPDDGGICAYDAAGKRVWERILDGLYDPANLILTDGVVIYVQGQLTDHWNPRWPNAFKMLKKNLLVVARDAGTGKQLWCGSVLRFGRPVVGAGHTVAFAKLENPTSITRANSNLRWSIIMVDPKTGRTVSKFRRVERGADDLDFDRSEHRYTLRSVKPGNAGFVRIGVVGSHNDVVAKK